MRDPLVAQDPPFVAEAAAARRRLLHENKQERAAITSLCDELYGLSSGPERDSMLAHLMGRSSKFARDSFAMVPGHVPVLQQVVAVKPHELDVAVEEVGGIYQGAANWKKSHCGILQATVACKIAAPPAVRRLCHEAERCVCRGDGVVDRRFAAALQAACRRWNNLPGWHSAIKNAEMVLLFEWEVRHVQLKGRCVCGEGKRYGMFFRR